MELLRMKKVLITGGNGMLGSAWTHLLSENERYEIRSFAHTELDVRSGARALQEVEWKPEIVIHTAGIVNADVCEENRDECFETHVAGTENIIELCKQTGAKLIYPQSFLIFDGEELPITEETVPHPLSVYGEAKLVAEEKIQSSLPDALIVRMGGFFGGYEKDKNFVGKFAHHLRQSLLEGKKTVYGTARVWQPSWTKSLAENTLLLIENNSSGVYNMASHGSASFYDVAKEMVAILGYDSVISVEEVPSDFFPEKCKRPENGTMENKRLKDEGFDRMSSWQESLAEYVAQPYFTELFSGIKKT